MNTPGWSGKRVLVFGALGGATLTAMEMLVLPLGLPAIERMEIVGYLLTQWTIVSIAIAALASFAEGRLRFPSLAASLAALAVALSALVAAARALADALGLSLGASPFAGAAPEWPTFLYNTWMILFFGGLFLAACVLSARAERTRYSLAAAEIARSRSEAALDAANATLLSACVDPAFLLRVMSEVERRYAASPLAADALLDNLVVFLRRAMPGVRGAATSLRAELALAHAYGRVWADLDPGRPRWQVKEASWHQEIPFPALWMLPLLDCWASAAGDGATATLSAQRTSGGIRLALTDGGTCASNWLRTDTEASLRTATRVWFGEDARLYIRTHDQRSDAFALDIPTRHRDPDPPLVRSARNPSSPRAGALLAMPASPHAVRPGDPA